MNRACAFLSINLLVFYTWGHVVGSQDSPLLDGSGGGNTRVLKEGQQLSYNDFKPYFSPQSEKFLGQVVGLADGQGMIVGSGIVVGRNSILTSTLALYGNSAPVKKVVFKGNSKLDGQGQDVLTYNIQKISTYKDRFSFHKNTDFPKNVPLQNYEVPWGQKENTCRREIALVKFDGLVGETAKNRLNMLSPFGKSIKPTPLWVGNWDKADVVYLVGYKKQLLHMGGEDFLMAPTTEGAGDILDPLEITAGDKTKEIQEFISKLPWGPLVANFYIAHDFGNHSLLSPFESKVIKPLDARWLDPLLMGSPVFRKTDQGATRLMGIALGYSTGADSPSLESDGLVVGSVMPCIGWIQRELAYPFEAPQVELGPSSYHEEKTELPQNSMENNQ